MCKVPHLVKNNPMHQCRLGGWLSKKLCRKGLGDPGEPKIIEHEPVKHPWGKGCLRKNIACRSREVFLVLYSFLVRPHLECFVQIWPLQYQRRHGPVEANATNMIKRVHKWRYRERLREPEFFSLEENTQHKKKICHRKSQNTGTCCLESLWSICHLRYSKPSWTWFCTSCCSWLCLSWGVWTRQSPEIPS